jgi:stearoyl-CoA desaturase (Delta-9 desaturase)
MSAPLPKDPSRYVLQSRDIQRTQARHLVHMVALPLVATVLGPWWLPHPINVPLAVFAFAAMATLVAGLGISAGFHRHFAHRAFKAKPWVRSLMVIAGQMAGQGPVLYWTALHRRHHAFSDQVGDPHSPALPAQTGPSSGWRAFWHAHVGWSMNHPVPMPSRYVADLLADRSIKRLNARYYACVMAGLVLPTVMGALWTRSVAGALTGLYFGGFLRMSITTQGIWAINSVCHRFGRRPHVTGDGSTNNAVVALITYGEGWHNNHHHQPTRARFGFGWSQPDAAWVIIATLRRLGLVWDVRETHAEPVDEVADKVQPA